MILTLCRLRNMAAMMVASLAVGCASVPVARFYTLSAPSGSSGERDVSPHSRQPAAPIFFEVMPVNVPERFARPQLVVRSHDAGQEARFFILEQDRWSSHFNYELRDAFAIGIASRTGAVNETRGIRTPDQPSYRIAIGLGQFDAIVGDRIEARFSWTITRSTDGQNAACYSAISEPVGENVEEVVKGMQRVVSKAVMDVSTNLIDLHRGEAATCAIQ